MTHVTRVFLAIAASIFAVGNTSASTITVCKRGCDHTSINAAIDAASDGDVIQLRAEIYTEGSVIDTDGKPITLRGTTDRSGVPTSVLDGVGTHRVLKCESGEDGGTIFENLVIRNGFASGNIPDNLGGGMYNFGTSNPVLTNCVVCGNSPDQLVGSWADDCSSCVMASCEDCQLPVEPCPTDLIQNCVTDVDDLEAFFALWGDCGIEDCTGDLNDDGIVDGVDLGILFAAWGPCQ